MPAGKAITNTKEEDAGECEVSVGIVIKRSTRNAQCASGLLPLVHDAALALLGRLVPCTPLRRREFGDSANGARSAKLLLVSLVEGSGPVELQRHRLYIDAQEPDRVLGSSDEWRSKYSGPR